MTPPKLDPSKLEDVRRAEAFGPRVSDAGRAASITRLADTTRPRPAQGLLLIGMDDKDCAAVQRWFEQMEAGCVVSCCPAALLADGTLRQAVQDGDVLPERPWQQHPPETPPIAFFSGMSGEEQVALIEGWAEHTGLEAPAFASGEPAARSAGQWAAAGGVLTPRRTPSRPHSHACHPRQAAAQACG